MHDAHTVLDHDGYIPTFVNLAEAKVHDSRISKILQLPKGSIVVFDRGYNDCRCFDELTREGVFFVTRLKSNADHQQIGSRTIRPRGTELTHQAICRLKMPSGFKFIRP